MRFREFLEVPVNNYRNSENVLKNILWNDYNFYNYFNIVEKNIERFVVWKLMEFIKKCQEDKKYLNYISCHLVTDSNKEDYFFEAYDFASYLYFENFFIEYQQTEIFKKNPTIEEIFNKHSSGIEKYQKDLAQSEENYQLWIKEIYEKARQIPNPNIDDMLTPDDKEILQKLKQKYTATELSLLIWTGILPVVGAIAENYPRPQYHGKGPILEDYLN